MLSSLLAKFEPGVEMVRAFYASRESREKRALCVLVGVLACVLFCVLLLAPLNNHLGHVRANIRHDEATFAWMQAADRVLSSPNAAHSASLTPVEALAALQTVIQQSSFSGSLKSLKQDGDQGIRLQLDAVSFDQLIVFLGEFEAKYALTVSALTVDRVGLTPGLVNATIMFAYPAHQK
jgi:type II secretory pathway component PulM